MRVMIWILLGCLFTLALFFSNPDRFYKLQYRQHIFFKQLGGEKQIPAGPLLDGFTIQQDFILDPSAAAQLKESRETCFNILMANYGGMKTGSNLVFAVELAGQQFEQVHPIDTIEDNGFHQVCYKFGENLPFDGRIRIEVRSVGAAHDRAVTFWLNSDLTKGEAQMNGIPSGGSLILKVGKPLTPPTEVLRASVALLLCFCLMLSLVIQVFFDTLFRKKDLNSITP